MFIFTTLVKVYLYVCNFISVSLLNTAPCLYFQTCSSWSYTWGHFWEHLWCWAASHADGYWLEDLWYWQLLCSHVLPPQWISQHWCYLKGGQINSDDETTCRVYSYWHNHLVFIICVFTVDHSILFDQQRCLNISQKSKDPENTIKTISLFSYSNNHVTTVLIYGAWSLL